MSLENIIQLYGDELRRFLAKYLSIFADIEDCSQETFLKVWLKVQQGGVQGNLRGYLFTTALNVVRDKRRRDRVRHRNRHVELSDAVLDLSDSTLGLRRIQVEDECYWMEALRLIEAELKNLQPTTRKVLLMCHLERKTYSEIASELGISVRTVEREIWRALEHMRKSVGNVIF